VGSVNFLEMLGRGRIDYLIEFPSIVSFLARESGMDTQKIKVVDIERKNQSPMGYVACGKSDDNWGKRTIARINEALTKIKPTDEYRQIMDKWRLRPLGDNFPPAFYEEVFLKN
jgi:uncharacterized protein (TIGR02285 family)